jgi:ABC-2 type transport system ATP-binding protein
LGDAGSKGDIITLENLTKYYHRSPGIDGVNLSVHEGEAFGLVGPGGSGKTTVVRCIMGLVRPTRGFVRIGGRNIAKRNVRYTHNIGYMPALMFDIDQMRVVDLLRYYLGFYRGEGMTRAIELAKRLDLNIDQRLEHISFTDKKKTAFILAIAHLPRIIVFDDPGNGLDPMVAARFYEIMQEESDRGATIILSSNDMNAVQRLCDRVAILQEGKLRRVAAIDRGANSYKAIRLISRKPIDLTAMGMFNARCAVGIGDEQLHDDTGGKAVSNKVSNLAIDGNRVSFMFRGDLSVLVDALQVFELRDLVIEEPKVDDIFLNYIK